MCRKTRSSNSTAPKSPRRAPSSSFTRTGGADRRRFSRAGPIACCAPALRMGLPLATPAIKLLKALPKFAGEALIFPSTRSGSKLSDMALLAVMRRMEADAVPHGFRSTFRDWCAEHTNYPREVAEVALAHSNKDETEAAYLRSDLFVKRRRLMDEWAAWCGSPMKKGTVVALKARRK